jgi:hypothetical protein
MHFFFLFFLNYLSEVFRFFDFSWNKEFEFVKDSLKMNELSNLNELNELNELNKLN